MYIEHVKVNTERLLAACTFELFAADRAYELAQSNNMPFRDAYRIVGAEVTTQLDRRIPFPVESQEQLAKRLKARSHLGGAGNLGLEISQRRIEAAQLIWQDR